MQYKNIPRTLGMIISSNMATLIELDTVYSIEDAYLMLEVISVNNYNQRMIQKHYEKQTQS